MMTQPSLPSPGLHIVAISGYAGQGKTTAANTLVELSGGAWVKASFSEPLKYILNSMDPIIGADGLTLREALRRYTEIEVKELFPNYRRYMQGLNSIKDVDQDFYARIGRERAEAAFGGGLHTGIVFDDLRFPTELAALRAVGGATVHTLRVGEPLPAHQSRHYNVTETAMDHVKPDTQLPSRMITGNSLAVLRENVANFYERITSVN